MIDFDLIWGIQEIADFTGLKEQTIRQYKTDGKLPDPDAIKSGNPLWFHKTIRYAVADGTLRRKNA